MVPRQISQQIIPIISRDIPAPATLLLPSRYCSIRHTLRGKYSSSFILQPAPPYQGPVVPPQQQVGYPGPAVGYSGYPNPPATTNTTVYVHEEVVVRPPRQQPQTTVVVREERERPRVQYLAE